MDIKYDNEFVELMKTWSEKRKEFEEWQETNGFTVIGEEFIRLDPEEFWRLTGATNWKLRKVAKQLFVGAGKTPNISWLHKEIMSTRSKIKFKNGNTLDMRKCNMEIVE